MEKKKWYKNIYLKFALVIIAVFIINSCSRSDCPDYFEKEEIKIKVEKDIAFIEKSKKDFSEEALIIYLKKINIKFPEIVLAQARLESGNFKSKLFLTHNNMFGMKKSYSRPSSSLKDSLGYAYFDNWKLSVLDYALYQSYFLRNYNSREEYLERIGRTYAEDEEYIQKIKRIIIETEKNFY